MSRWKRRYPSIRVPVQRPDERLTYEERVFGWPQPAFTGFYHWVVSGVVVKHIDLPEKDVRCSQGVLIKAQNGQHGLNFRWREGRIWAPLRRSPEGAASERRTRLDEILERICGALPPVDWPLGELVGVNFVGFCRQVVCTSKKARSGYRLRAVLDLESLRPYVGAHAFAPIIEAPNERGPGDADVTGAGVPGPLA